MRTKKGIYKIKKPEKYDGNPHNVVYRSSWEKSLMAWCEMHPNIRKWSSEESVCPYYDPVRQKHRRYFIDFKLEFDSGRILYVEVKPRQETKPPKITARKSDGKIMLEMATWGTNQAKWKAASEWAAKRGGKFVVWSEKELALLGIISLEKEKPRRKRS